MRKKIFFNIHFTEQPAGHQVDVRLQGYMNSLKRHTVEVAEAKAAEVKKMADMVERMKQASCK